MAWYRGINPKGSQLIEKEQEVVGENDLIYYSLGMAYFQFINIGIKTDAKYLDMAEEYAKKAIQLNPSSPDALSLISMIHETRGDVRKAIEYSKRAIEFGPNNVNALLIHSFLYCVVGKGNLAKPYADRLLQIDPLSSTSYVVFIWLFITQGEQEKLLEYAQKLYDMDPQNPGCRWYLGWALLVNNYKERALDIFNLIVKQNPETIYASLSWLYTHSLNDNISGFHEALDEKLIQIAEIDHLFSWLLAECFALIGDNDAAITWLEKAVNKGRIDYPFLNNYDRLLDNIRGEERFKKLMERVKKEWDEFEV